MADEADRANDQAQARLDAAIASRRKAAALDPQGYCLAPRCGEDFDNSKRLFCNAKCAQDYEKSAVKK